MTIPDKALCKQDGVSDQAGAAVRGAFLRANLTRRSIAARSFVYILAIALTLAAFPPLVERYQEAFYNEGRLLENAQHSLIVVIGLIFVFSAWCFSELRSFFITLSIPAGLVLAREHDKSLDALIPVLGWQAVAAVVFALGGIYTFKRRETIIRTVESFLCSFAFGVLWSGAVVLLVIAQLVGHGDLLHAQLGNEYNANTKRLVEESIEFAAYMLLFFGSIEAALWGAGQSGITGSNEPSDKGSLK